eukprot:1791130-Alexandrium_andersonii.AAC.1
MHTGARAPVAPPISTPRSFVGSAPTHGRAEPTASSARQLGWSICELGRACRATRPHSPPGTLPRLSLVLTRSWPSGAFTMSVAAPGCFRRAPFLTPPRPVPKLRSVRYSTTSEKRGASTGSAAGLLTRRGVTLP